MNRLKFFVTVFSMFAVLAFLQAPSSQAATESVGGGVWNFGCDTGVWAYSDYLHNSRPHSATVTWHGDTSRSVAGARVWAQSGLAGFFWDTPRPQYFWDSW